MNIRIRWHALARCVARRVNHDAIDELLHEIMCFGRPEDGKTMMKPNNDWQISIPGVDRG
jgi:hypothetical protein